MKGYVESGEQLVVELYVRHLRDSYEFYRALGFEVVRDAGKFVELQNRIVNPRMGPCIVTSQRKRDPSVRVS
jgi:catechol 2,3-dioxygenase-like lactoylglutathione lyase family enzyme